MNRMLALIAIGLLVACSPPDQPAAPSEQHVQLARACVSSGGDKAHCECQASKLDELLEAGTIDLTVYKALVLQAEGKEEEAEKAFMALDYDARFKQSTLAGEAMVSCDAAPAAR